MTPSSLRYGVYLPPFGPFGDPAVLVDLATRAEAAGWDGLFLWDHVVSDGRPIVDTWTMLGVLAGATESLLLGPAVTPLPRRRPWVVARQASTVSRLSGGRLVVGVGAGSDESGDFSRFREAADVRARSAMLDEGLGILRAVWSGQQHRHEGLHYTVDLEPAPPEPHRIPIWSASSSRHPRVIRRAVACDGIFPIADRTLTAQEVATIVATVHSAGRPVDRRLDVAVAGNASAAWERPNPDGVDLATLAGAGATWWMESLIHLDPLEQSLQVVDAGPPRP